MTPMQQHSQPADVGFDGGDLDCGNGLLLLIRRHINPLPRGGLLEIRSTEISVDEDLPAWCRLTGNELVSVTKVGLQRSFLVCKGALSERVVLKPMSTERAERVLSLRERVVPVTIPTSLPQPAAAPEIVPLSVMGIGSWPRPRWLMRALHEHLEGRLGDDEFEAAADDAVRLAVSAQIAAGVDVVSDGEQRRDSYASFVGARLDNCELIPLTDILPLVDDPEHFAEELRALDVPAADVRHPFVFGPLGRSRPLVAHEVRYVRTLTDKPVKVALPGPYLLTRTMWLECLADQAYASREALAADIVRILREEIFFALAEGAAIVQLDEPVLSEVVFAAVTGSSRSFMCGALSARGNVETELSFARELLHAVLDGVPRERVAMHMCRGNWTRDESAALSGDYAPLIDLFKQLPIGMLLLETCTPRAGDLAILKALPDDMRVGIGVVNQKLDAVESVAAILAKAEDAIRLLGAERVLLTPDCGFATFADNPLASSEVAAAKMRAIAEAAVILKAGYGV
ncbi:5-methyltetrahydropteroyltriglutamate--homocysteine methyltransferase [Beijerinckia sp. L45]|uniref:5-methyltetrahydropteroyltriglutamate-- homocysteine methyltransferase n=1 Tax=Beijerinckia sp. L45 TaxID=1641855 RepID=UPI00131E14EE|nr:5-methyltetrahydropteroyltriglutamate--homocysteine methyltransferase [Beijerinckia sp. L45]